MYRVCCTILRSPDLRGRVPDYIRACLVPEFIRSQRTMEMWIRMRLMKRKKAEKIRWKQNLEL